MKRIDEIIDLELTISELVTITHRKGTPWDHTNINDIITDEVDTKIINFKKSIYDNS